MQGGLCSLCKLLITMAIYHLSIHSKVMRLRYKYRDSIFLNDCLSQILWYSFPVVYPNYFNECKKISLELDKLKDKRKRIRKYIRGMKVTFDELYLVTLTFDDTYDTTITESRKKYAQRWLNEYTLDYFACLDFGKKNGREHYHAICAFDFPLEAFLIHKHVFYRLPKPALWNFGFYSIRKIKSDVKDVYKSLSYAFKSADYAIKSSADVNVKPFHKRTVLHYEILESDLLL